MEGDEQPDHPRSQTCMECCHAFAACIFWMGVVINTLVTRQPSSHSTMSQCLNSQVVYGTASKGSNFHKISCLFSCTA